MLPRRSWRLEHNQCHGLFYFLRHSLPGLIPFQLGSISACSFFKTSCRFLVPSSQIFVLSINMARMVEALRTRCCIAGGGPAGMMLGFLLARMGVDVVVLEKHADFLRDFRGDTIHPSTLEIMYELGILDEFLKRPHQEVRHLAGQIGNETVTPGRFHAPAYPLQIPRPHAAVGFSEFHCRDSGQTYPSFHLKMQAEVRELIEEGGRVVGVQAQTPEGALEIRADLTVGADGRHSMVRERAGLEVLNLGAPMDVLWMRISRHPTDPGQTFGRFDTRKNSGFPQPRRVLADAYVIPKGKSDELRQQGLPAFRQDLVRLAPFLQDRVDELSDWDDIKLLTVAVDRLRRWFRPGLLCIGDAAHAMSPIGGVGINLAIQDAVATANHSG